MGQANSAPVRDLWYGPELRPDWKKEPTFDPLVGFPNGRKIRGMYVRVNRENSKRNFCK